VKTSIERTVRPAYLKYRYIHIPAKLKDLFPNIKTTQELDLETDIGIIKTTFYSVERGGPGIRSFGLVDWFKAHPELKAGDRLRITAIEPMKKYRLEIVK